MKEITVCHNLRTTTKLILNFWGHKKILKYIYLKKMWEGLNGTMWEEIHLAYQISVWVKSLGQGGIGRMP